MSSRLPISIMRTPTTIQTIPPTPKRLANLTSNINIDKPAPAHAPNADHDQSRVIVFHASSNQLTPQSPISPQNFTVNVNVSNSMPQSPLQATKMIRTNDKNIENATNNDDDGDDNDKGNGSSDSRITNDSDSTGSCDGNGRNSSGRDETPIADHTNVSARRKLFAMHDDTPIQRNETFNKINNNTKTFDGNNKTHKNEQLTGSPKRRGKKYPVASNLHKKSSHVMPPNSETFTKSKTSLPNATYDIVTANASNRCGIDTEEFLAVQNGQSTFDNVADLPSDAILDPIDISDDESNDNNVAVGLNMQNDELTQVDKQPQHIDDSQSISNQNQRISISSNNMMPILKLNRVSIKTPSQTTLANISNVRASRSYNCTAPELFQDSCNNVNVENNHVNHEMGQDDIIVEFSPNTKLQLLKEVSHIIIIIIIFFFHFYFVPHGS